MKHLELTKQFCDFLDNFSDIESINLNMEEEEVSQAIFYHIFKIKQSLWKQSENFKRRKRIAISDILQDIIAYYLNATLSKDFNVVLEEKKGKLRPDILIQYRSNNLFIIEVKTTIGWERNLLNDRMRERIEALSSEFDVSTNNIVYIFESPWNVNKRFTGEYWDIKENKRRIIIHSDFPYSKIRPLFSGEDPYYYKGEDRRFYCDAEIYRLAKSNIVIPLELTIKDIITAAKISSI